MGPEHPQRLEKQSGEDSVNLPLPQTFEKQPEPGGGGGNVGLLGPTDRLHPGGPGTATRPSSGARPPLPEESQPTLDDAGRGQRGSLPSSPFQLNQCHPWPNQIRSSWEESPANSLLGLSAPTPVHSRVGGMRVEERAGE